MKQESGYVNAFDLSKNPEIGAAVAAVATGSADKVPKKSSRNLPVHRIEVLHLGGGKYPLASANLPDARAAPPPADPVTRLGKVLAVCDEPKQGSPNEP
jgi:hypothetical protein